MKIKRLIAAALSAAALFTLGACNGNNNKTSENSGTYETEIIVGDYVSASSGVDAWIARRQDKFDEMYPKYKVWHVANPNSDSSKQVQTAVTELSGNSDTTCTVMSVSANVYARTIWNTGLTEDWSKYVKDWEYLDSINDDILAGVMRKDNMIAFPSSQEMVCLGFNKNVLKALGIPSSDIVDENGVSKIKTWDDFKAIAKRLTKNSPVEVAGKIVPNVWGYGGCFQDFYLGLGSWLIANGYDFAIQNDDRTIDLNYTSPKAIETFNMFAELSEAGALRDNLNYNMDTFFSYLTSNQFGSFIFYPAWSSFVSTLGLYNEDIILVPIPNGYSATEQDKTSTIYAQCYILNRNATEEQKKLAALYVEFMSGPEAWEEKINFITQREIGVFSVPAYDGVEIGGLLSSLPKDWQTTISSLEGNGYISTLDSDNYINYIANYIPDLITKTARQGESKLKEELTKYQNNTYNEWLDNYNKNVLSGRYDR